MDKPQSSSAPAGAPAPAAPPGKVRVDFLAAAKAKAAEMRSKEQKPEEPKAEQPKVEAKVEPKPEVKPEAKPEVKPEDALTKSYEKLAQEREQTRKLAEEVKAQAARYTSIERAIAAKDATALLGLAGITPEEFVRNVTGAKDVEVQEQKAERNPEVEEVRKELAALKAEREAERARAATTQLVGVVQNELKSLAEKLPLASKLPEESAQQALEVMQKHFERTGQNLAEDARESIKLALEIVEERHQAVVRKYGLTTPQKQASIVPEATEATPRVESVVLTQRDERPSMGESQAQPLKPEDYRARVKAMLRNKTLGT